MVNDAVEPMEETTPEEPTTAPEAVVDPSTGDNAAPSTKPASDTVSENTPEAKADNEAPNADASAENAVDSAEPTEVVEEAPVAEVSEAATEEATTEADATASAEVAEDEAPETEISDVNNVSELSIKQQVTGVVSKVTLAGAIVNLGPAVQGFLHISQLSEKRVKNVTDVVNEGDRVDAYVMEIDNNKQRVVLTMIKPPDRTWAELQSMVNQNVTGKVVRIEKFGAFIDIGAERPGLIHVSELSDDYISSPEEKVSVGDEIEARIIGVDTKKRQVDLSVKALTAQIVIEEEEDDNDVPMTAMEIAMRRAMVKDQKKRRKQKSR